mmetsp:Transcript_8566/g.13882  ORF Transcript_8566/g.13882 Transcript_8566/m.13882 type:complete len:124 (-) Transcript_8566:440-811(-)
MREEKNTDLPPDPLSPPLLQRRSTSTGTIRRRHLYAIKNPSALDLFRYDETLVDAPVRANPFDKKERMRNGLAQLVTPPSKSGAVSRRRLDVKDRQRADKYIGLYLIVSKLLSAVQVSYEREI